MIRSEDLAEEAAALRALQDESNQRHEAKEVELASIASPVAMSGLDQRDASQRLLSAVFALERKWDDIASHAATGDAEAIGDALTYLEVRPRFFRSGYLAERLIRRLVQAPDLVPYANRVGSIAIGYSKTAAQREIPLIGNLVGKAWTVDLEKSLEAELGLAEAQDLGHQLIKLRYILASATHWKQSAVTQRRD